MVAFLKPADLQPLHAKASGMSAALVKNDPLSKGQLETTGTSLTVHAQSSPQ